MKQKLPNIASNNGKFTDGNPATGQLGTRVTAAWLNDVQDRHQDFYSELANVLALAGYQPDSNKNNQIAEALKYYFLGGHGEQTIHNGGLTISQPLVLNNPNDWWSINKNVYGGVWKLEFQPNSTVEKLFQFKFYPSNGSPVAAIFPNIAKNETVAYQGWVSDNYVAKSGATMTGDLNVPYLLVKRDHAWATIMGTGNHDVSLDFGVNSSATVHTSLVSHRNNDNSVEFHLWLSPANTNHNLNRRTHIMTVMPDGKIWTKQYGWLHDYFMAKTVTRRDYNKIINGTSTWDSGTSKTISVTGQVIIYPDGKIEQFFHFKNFRVRWFDYEEAVPNHGRSFEIPVQLWTAMPNKITNLQAQLGKATNGNTTANSEAMEWIPPSWNLFKQGATKDRCYLIARRFTGDADEPIDMYIKVEGY